MLGAVLITTVLTVPGFHNLFKVETLNLMQLGCVYLYAYADFHSTCIGILYYIPGVRISAPKKTTYKTSNENGCGRVCGGGNCVILYCAE